MSIKILAVGGGSGGHVTPVVAVLRELKKNDPKTEIRFWCDKKFAKQAKNIVNGFDSTIRVDTITAGKLRRYHHLTLLQHITIPSVFWPNVRDFFLVIVGVIQSIVKLFMWRPDVVFTKGGYVCLPVGWAASLLRIPLVVHDSDAHPGLTNRLLAKRAVAIATGAPLEYYKYPKDKSTYVGIPIGEQFVPFDEVKKQLTKRGLGIDPERPLIVITGGGLGAKLINDEVALHANALMEFGTVILISGADQYDELKALTPQNDDRFRLHAFVSEGMAEMLGAADVVVSRAGATTLLELAALAKPTVLVPNGRLTGGHQLKNAKVYSDKNAVLVINDEDFGHSDNTSLVDAIHQVLVDKQLRHKLSENIHSFAKPHAAKDVASIIMTAAQK